MFVAAGASANSAANYVCRERGLQGRVIWFDAEANLWALSTREGVADTVAKCKAAHINTIIVDVKPLSGHVLYMSKIAPRLQEFEGRQYPANYDLLRTVLEEGHKAGIKVHAAINVFSEGSTTQGGGAAQMNPEWQAVQYDVRRFLSASDGTNMELHCAGGQYQNGKICLYAENAGTAGKLPPDTVYVRVDKDGRPLQSGTATGKAKLSAPDGGYVLVANGEAGEWLKKVAQTEVRFKLDGQDLFIKVGEMGDVHHAIFVNPSNPEARAFALSIVKEITENYPIDGLVLDRMRFPNIYTDFSDESRRKFEESIGQPVQNWPDDVFRRRPAPGDDIIRGPYFKQWLKFRAQIIRDFLADVRQSVKSIRQDTKLGIYVGSWYPLYYDVGVNWGNPNSSTAYEWWPEGYQETGYADLLDYMCTGCYYMYPTRREAKQHNDQEWKSVEAAAEESIKAVDDATFVYGSLYLYQYKGLPQKFREALQQCLDKTQGCMLFDLVYVRDYNWWSLLRDTFPRPAEAPHDVPGLIEKVKSLKR